MAIQSGTTVVESPTRFSTLKILISACVMGENVRWNGINKLNREIIDWAEENNVELVPVCPETELFGTPRKPIRLMQVEDQVKAMMGKDDVYAQLLDQARRTLNTHSDAVGFIGISNSPTCGISVGVKNRGSTMKAPMHSEASFPTTEINSLRTAEGLDRFLYRVEKNENR